MTGKSSLRVGYVMTHYPRVALTFIESEIAQVKCAGIEVLPYAMNLPSAADMLAVGAEAKHAATTYLKASWAKAGLAWATAWTRHPIAMSALTLRALRSAGTDPALMAKRMAHLVQGALLAKHAAKSGITHLHAHFGLAPATIAWFATEVAHTQKRPATFSFTIHGFHDFIDPMIARLDLKAAAASYVICISDFTRSQLCRGTDPALWSKYHVVRCGVDLDQFAYRPPPAHKGAVKIMALGRLSAEKGFAVLIEAVASLRQSGREVHLTLVGDGPLRRDLETQVTRLGIDDSVRFAGELVSADVAKELRGSDIFCLPSFSEGLPVSIMEAMAVGVPVITTWISGIPELAVNGETALTVAPSRADSIAQAIDQLAQDHTLCTRLAQTARARVEALHDTRTTGAEMAALLATTLKETLS